MIYETTRKVRFEDTDLSGFVHFSRYLVFVEDAEHEFLQLAIGDLFTRIDGLRLGWPRLKLSCSYKGPLSYGDRLRVVLIFEKIGPATISYKFKISTENALAAEGQVVVGCCFAKEDGCLEPILIPEHLLEKIVVEPREE